MGWLRLSLPDGDLASVAQRIRAPVFGTGCRGFESLLMRQIREQGIEINDIGKDESVRGV